MKITRKQILTAIRYEPLKARAFFHERSLSGMDVPVRKSTCKVCAVGAVLRRAAPKGWTLEDADSAACRNTVHLFYGKDGNYDREGERAEMLKNGEYLDVLSCEFEHMVRSRVPYATIRTRLANFVKKNFPKEIVING